MTRLTPFTRILRRRTAATLTALTLTAGALSGCGALDSAGQDDQDAAVAATASADSVWDASAVHVVALELDEEEFADMVATYDETGEKEWITVDVTIDGRTVRDVGVRLKGNSSLRSVDADADPADLPWLIDLDRFVDGQSLDGWESFVVRSSTSQTALNEAVALDLLEEAGLASQQAVATRFSVNGSQARLRLLVQDLDNRWDEATFGTDGTLYKSEAGGDWSYRGEEASAYADVFDIEAGTEDYEPLTDLLRWLEESSDQEFADGLAERLDVEAFATYLAFEDLIGNVDDIEGPGNNSYLRWDAGTQKMTVVAWDHNLAFGAMGDMQGEGGPGFGGEPPEGFQSPNDQQPPEGFDPPDGAEPPEGDVLPDDLPGGIRPDGDARGSGPGGSNVLAERFRDTPELARLYDQAVERLRAELYDDGTAQDVLDTWTALLEDQAGDLVEESAVEDEAQDVSSYFDGHAVEESGDGRPRTSDS